MGRKDLEESDRPRWRKTSSEKEERGVTLEEQELKAKRPPEEGGGGVHRQKGGARSWAPRTPNTPGLTTGGLVAPPPSPTDCPLGVRRRVPAGGQPRAPVAWLCRAWPRACQGPRITQTCFSFIFLYLPWFPSSYGIWGFDYWSALKIATRECAPQPRRCSCSKQQEPADLTPRLGKGVQLGEPCPHPPPGPREPCSPPPGSRKARAQTGLVCWRRRGARLCLAGCAPPAPLRRRGLAVLSRGRVTGKLLLSLRKGFALISERLVFPRTRAVFLI